VPFSAGLITYSAYARAPFVPLMTFLSLPTLQHRRRLSPVPVTGRYPQRWKWGGINSTSRRPLQVAVLDCCRRSATPSRHQPRSRDEGREFLRSRRLRGAPQVSLGSHRGLHRRRTHPVPNEALVWWADALTHAETRGLSRSATGRRARGTRNRTLVQADVRSSPCRQTILR
jgi:hypothetical protein